MRMPSKSWESPKPKTSWARRFSTCVIGSLPSMAKRPGRRQEDGWAMPSKGQIQAEREAEARRVAARTRLDSDVRTALADGLPAEEVAMHYNFARVHQTLRVTPAMEAGVSGLVATVASWPERVA